MASAGGNLLAARAAERIAELERQLAAANRQIDLSIELHRIALAAEKAAREKAKSERDELRQELTVAQAGRDLNRNTAEILLKQRDEAHRQRDELAAAQAELNSWAATVSLMPKESRTKAEQKLVEICGKTLGSVETILAERDAALIEARVRPLVEVVAKIRELVHMWADEKSPQESVLNHIHSIAVDALAPYQPAAPKPLCSTCGDTGEYDYEHRDQGGEYLGMERVPQIAPPKEGERPANYAASTAQRKAAGRRGGAKRWNK